MRRLAALVLCALASVPAATAEAAPRWVRPVNGRVMRPFAPPVTAYGPGHVGVDLAAAPGTPVRAAGGGRVEFAGEVAHTRHVVVRHAGGLRTSYSFLASIRVHAGDVVGTGAVLGTTGGTGEGHDGRVLHFGLRAGDRYLDPMQLFAPDALDTIVALAPLGARRADPVVPPAPGPPQPELGPPPCTDPPEQPCCRPRANSDISSREPPNAGRYTGGAPEAVSGAQAHLRTPAIPKVVPTERSDSVLARAEDRT